MNATEVIIPSDSRLTENVMALSNTVKSDNETLGNIMNMNVIKYNFINRPEEVSDTFFLSDRNRLLRRNKYTMASLHRNSSQYIRT